MQRDTARRDMSGLALLMRQGMAVWMRRVSDVGVAAASGDIATPSAIPAMPGRSSTLEQLLVNIVAAMALVHAKEAFA